MIFSTTHFIVRHLTMDDADDFLTFWADQEVMKFIGDGTWGGGPAVVEKVLKDNIAFYDSHEGLGFFALVDKSCGRVVGEVGLHPTGVKENEIEVGYVFHKSYWGKGYATEVLSALLTYGFALGLKEIIAVAHPQNLASIRVMEKCGMRFLDHAVYHNRFSVKYALTK